MNLSLVSLTEKPALYLPEADELIKSRPLWGGAFIHLFIFFTQSQIYIRVASVTYSHRATISFLRLWYRSSRHWRGKKTYLSIRGDRRIRSRRVCWYRYPRAGKVSPHTHSRPGHTVSQNTLGGTHIGTWGRCDNTRSEGSDRTEEPDDNADEIH